MLTPTPLTDELTGESIQNHEPGSESFSRGFWTVTRKLTLLVVVVVAIGIATVATVGVNHERTSLQNMATQNYIAMSELLAEQVAGAIRWNKADKAAGVFDRNAKTEGSPLQAMSAYGLAGSKNAMAVKFATNEYADTNAQIIDDKAGKQPPDELTHSRTDTHLVVVVPVHTGKENTRVGTLVLAWDVTRITAALNRTSRNQTALSLGILIVLAVLLGIVISRSVGRPITAGVAVASRIAKGHLDNTIHIKTHDELGELANALRSVQANLIANDDSERQKDEFGRIKQALDCANISTLLADTNQEIVYANRAAIRLFSNNESELQNAGLSDLRASALVGNALNVFKQFDQLYGLTIDQLNGEKVIQIEAGALTLQVTLTPVIDEDGQRLGTVLEWLDRSREVSAEQEVQSMVDAAARGDFSQRIDTDNMKGYNARIASMLNKLASISEVGLNDTLRVLKALAGGDLAERIDADYEGVFAELKEACNTTSKQLHGIVDQISNSAEEVRSGAAEISVGNIDLSNRTEQQAENLEETAAAMEEMAATVDQNAKNAHQANLLAEGARADAESGGEVAAQAVTAVGEISTASKKIVDIISVIDEIAFQTNLLALNAAVEAARAGEQGRGFAVVASEVRNLAGRSAAAAKQIKGLIEDSVEKVDQGAKLVEQSGEALTAIVSSVIEVSDTVSMIANASTEQTEGIRQINSSMAQIDDMTKRNAALVKEAAVTSQAVGEQASQLDELIQFFGVGNTLDGDDSHITNMTRNQPYSNRAAAS